MALTKVSTPGIKDEAITLAKLLHGTSSNDGKFLRANNGADPTFENISQFTTLTEHVGADASNRSAGDLIIEGTDTDSSGSVTDDDRTIYDKSLNKFKLGRNVKLEIGFLTLQTKLQATNHNNGHIIQYSAHLNMTTGADIWLSTVGKRVVIGTSDTANHEVASFQCSASGASQHGFVALNYVTANYGQSTSMVQRLLTTQTGLTLTGDVIPATTQAHDLGSSSKKWSNIHADYFYGSGANLTSLPAGQLTGTVADARISTLTASKLTGALPAIDGSNLTGISSVGGATGVDFNDGVKARFGTGNDGEIFHNGTDFHIDGEASGGATRNIYITGGSVNEKVIELRSKDNEPHVRCYGDGAVEIYHNNEKKFITTGTGVRIENTSSPLTTANSSANEFVVTGDGAMGMTLHTTNTSSNCGIHFADGTSGNATYRGTIIYRHLHDQLRFSVNGGTLAQQINSDLTVSFQNTIYASSFSTASDLTLKSNLVRFTNTLDKLKELNGYTFDMKVGEAKDITIASAGIIAQDVEKVFPELVSTETGSDYKTVQYNGLIGVLVEAVKELTTKVAALEAA
jgi:hypothetical protein|tara:strand:+ start:9170 stop:10885 length:1716 start_codon:yes stop_codon:yes gene_type:complete